MKLIKLKTGFWKLEMDNKSIEANPIRVRQYMTCDLCIPPAELDFAMAEMSLKHHDTAHFGLQGTFLHTSDSSAIKRVLIELAAIKSVREEFLATSKADDALGLHAVGGRLLNLYAGLNVEGIMQILYDINNVEDKNLVA